MATIVYLDADDEITSAATRIRSAEATRVGLVLPFGSRVATSRINFRLLAREAQTNGRRLDIVAPEASARALAASAGLPVFGSVAEYEAALDAGLDDRDAGVADAAAAGAAVAATTTKAAESIPLEAAAPIAAVAVTAAALSPDQGPPADPADQADLDEFVAAGRQLPVARPRRRRPGTAAIVASMILVLAIVVSAAAALLVLPAADITVTPRIEPVGPIAITVTADPQVAEVDPAALVIPAQTLDVPVEVSGDFPATGKRVEETKAKGTVRWTNCDPTASYTIPKGTHRPDDRRHAFVIDGAGAPLRGALSGSPRNLTSSAPTNDVDVTAVEAGKDGNVAAGAIKVVPARYNRKVISVNNRAATSGGTRTEFARVSQKDVDAALVALEAELETELAAGLQDPDLAPQGTTVFPETAVAGESAPTVDPATLVGQEVETFTLGLTATGTVLAVDEGPIEAIAEAQLAAAVDDGYSSWRDPPGSRWARGPSPRASSTSPSPARRGRCARSTQRRWSWRSWA